MKDEGLETMNISFLRGHVVQLTQRISQFALKPGENEIKAKLSGTVKKLMVGDKQIVDKGQLLLVIQ